MQKSDSLLQPCGVYELRGKLAGVHEVEEIAEDIWLYICCLQPHTVTETETEDVKKTGS